MKDSTTTMTPTAKKAGSATPPSTALPGPSPHFPAAAVVGTAGEAPSSSASTPGPDADEEYDTVLSASRKLVELLRPGIRKHARGLALAYLISLGRICASLAISYFLGEMVDHALPHRDVERFTLYGVSIGLCLVLFYVSSLGGTWFAGRTLEHLYHDLRNRMVATVLGKSARFFREHENGDLITRISHDTESLSVLSLDYFFPNLQHLTMVLCLVLFTFSLEWRVGLYVLVTLPIYIALMSFFQRTLSRAARTARERLSEQNGTVLDILAGAKEIRLYQQLPEAARRFGEAADRFAEANIRSACIGEWSYNTMELFARALTTLPFLVGGFLIAHGVTDITVGRLVACDVALAFLDASLQNTLFGVTRLIQASPLVQRIREVLDYPEEHIEPLSGESPFMESTRIEFRDVCFAYEGGRPLLRNVNLVVEPGEKVAIMGPSGSGKSTLIDLLTRHVVPGKGVILMDGRPIESYNLPLYLLHFACVSQTPYIFRTSVLENIAAGWYDVPRDIIVDAARRVGLHEAILRLPQGYDTPLRAEGTTLSGGQRQRLALARALVRDPEVLLLDEFTSALDRATEEALLDDLLAGFRNQTILCVTHSEAVASRFDRIVHLAKL